VSNVVLIGIGSLTTAIDFDELSNLNELIHGEHGLFTNARGVMPSTSLVNWASILFGAGSEVE
jgi:hypothetical protein